MKTWMGTVPAHCDICGRTLVNSGIFVDGKTKMGPWAMMCAGCHGTHGVGLGSGKGQKYVQSTPGSKVWNKVEE